MNTRQLQVRAYEEWSHSPELKGQYHTFDYYWWERYARVFQLPARIGPVERIIH